LTVEIDLTRLEKHYLTMSAEQFSLLRKADLTPGAAEIYDRVASIRRTGGNDPALEGASVSSGASHRDKMADSVTRILHGCAGLVGNILGAVIGVGILKTPSSPLVKLFTHSRASIILTEWIGSIIFAALLGVSVQQRWRSRSARWVWTPALLWFLFGLVMYSRLGNPLLTFSGIACVDERGFSCIPFTVFTVILVRCSVYSLAAFLSARSSRQYDSFHPVLSHILSGLFLTGLPKLDKNKSENQ
jgi:integral membrane sensor domain MASE1